MATVPPGKRQPIRLTRLAEGAPGTEDAYRVLIDEIPQPDDNTSQPGQTHLGVKFQMHYSIPLFVYGKGIWTKEDPDHKRDPLTIAQPFLSWHLACDGGKRCWLVMTNHGQVHARIVAIPGIGLLTATAAVATMGDAKVFRSGREFAAYIGLVPKQSGSGGKVNLQGISKRGDTYLRTLLTHGARSVLANAKDLDPWIEQIRKRRPPNVVIVALANKMARTIWAVLAHEKQYEKTYVSAKPT
nr:transposase [Burkholderia cepacia]